MALINGLAGSKRWNWVEYSMDLCNVLHGLQKTENSAIKG